MEEAIVMDSRSKQIMAPREPRINFKIGITFKCSPNCNKTSNIIIAGAVGLYVSTLEAGVLCVKFVFKIIIKNLSKA